MSPLHSRGSPNKGDKIRNSCLNPALVVVLESRTNGLVADLRLASLLLQYTISPARSGKRTQRGEFYACGEACPNQLTCHDTVASQVHVVVTCCWFLDHYRLVVGIKCLNLQCNILTPTSRISKNSIACVLSCILLVDVMGFGLPIPQLLRALPGRTLPGCTFP